MVGVGWCLVEQALAKGKVSEGALVVNARY